MTIGPDGILDCERDRDVTPVDLSDEKARRRICRDARGLTVYDTKTERYVPLIVNGTDAQIALVHMLLRGDGTKQSIRGTVALTVQQDVRQTIYETSGIPHRHMDGISKILSLPQDVYRKVMEIVAEKDMALAMALVMFTYEEDFTE